jgi:hypothetical protein
MVFDNANLVLNKELESMILYTSKIYSLTKKSKHDIGLRSPFFDKQAKMFMHDPKLMLNQIYHDCCNASTKLQLSMLNV